MKKIIPILLVGFLLSSCAAFHSGIVTDSASLSSANFSYVNQNVQGSAATTYILNIGGLGRETLVSDAKMEMMKSNPLEDNQAYANMSVNFKRSFILGFLIQKMQCIVTADVVEFNK
jgi:hypothetical protein